MASTLGLALGASLAACASKPPVELLILHTGDVRGRLRHDPPRLGAAVVATELRRLSRAHPDLVRLDAGGFSDPAQGPPEVAYAIASMLDYDAAALGAPEIALGPAGVRRLQDLATFPLLGANVVPVAPGSDEGNGDGAPRGGAPAGDAPLGDAPLGDAPWVILERRGVRIAVIGVVSRHATPPAGYRVVRPRDALRPIVAELADRADVVVVLAHAGAEECGRLARRVPGLTLVIGGAGREPIGEPVPVGDAWVAHASDHLLDLGRIELVWDVASKRVVEVHGGAVRPDATLAPDVREAVDAADSASRTAPRR